MALRIDRLELLTAVLIQAVETADMETLVPPRFRPVLALSRRLAGLDLIKSARDAWTSSMRSMLERARTDPAAAEAWLRWAVHVVAWLDGQTDRHPQMLPGGPSPLGPFPSSAAATGPSSSATPAPASPSSPVP